jgi:nickel-dependent lactate racemase
MLLSEIEIILKDELLQNIELKTALKQCNVYQCKMPETTITKYVYKNNNEVFCNKTESVLKPKCKCVFTLHTDEKSSFVQIFDNLGVEIFKGNSLWSSLKSKTELEHLSFIKLLHSVDNVIENYDC